MNFLQNAIIFAIVSIVAAQNYQFQPEDYQPQPTSGKVLQIPEYVTLGQNPTLIAYTLQLPKEDAPNVPFYDSKIIANLQPPKVPAGQNVPIYYDYPEPSVDLQAPSVGSWNPNNDPNYYYGSLPVVIDVEAPTNQHPKKFNKDIHEKKYSGEPKKEVILKPVTVDELGQLQKTVDKFAKLENKKQIRTEKAEQTV